MTGWEAEILRSAVFKEGTDQYLLFLNFCRAVLHFSSLLLVVYFRLHLFHLKSLSFLFLLFCSVVPHQRELRERWQSGHGRVVFRVFLMWLVFAVPSSWCFVMLCSPYIIFEADSALSRMVFSACRPRSVRRGGTSESRKLSSEFGLFSFRRVA